MDEGKKQRSQADAVNATMASLGVPIDAPDSQSNANEVERSQELELLEMPRDGWGLDDFAREAGKVTRQNGVFRREMVPVTINESGLIEVIEANFFRTYLADLAFLFKWKATGKDLPPARVKVTMSADTARGTLTSPQFTRQQRKLSRVNAIRQPILTEAGKPKLLPVGYDAESGVYTLESDVEIREEMEIDEAHAILLDLHREFPFGDWCHLPLEERHESRELAKHVASMVGFYASLMLPHTIKRQGTLYNANTHRSGKTLLAQIVVIPVMGRCDLQTKPHAIEEFRKLLDSTACTAAPYLVLDDLTGDLRSQALNSFMTTPWWSGRLMNTQRTFAVPIHCNIFLTGHNLETSGDIAGRVLEVKLHVEEADVQTHKVRRVINERWLSKPAVRSDICSALYAIVRHWFWAGKPEGKTTKPGYEDWCKMFGGMIEAAGFGDPFERRDTDETTDAEFEDMRILVQHFGEKMDDETKVVEIRYDELILACQELSLFEWLIEGKWEKDEEGARCFAPSSKTNSKLGLLWSRKYGGRIFSLDSGQRVRFGSRGRQRHKKYVLNIE